ncbi:hypothetical protein GCM10028803_49030 [Larkinella knui]|uniref:Alpha/beta hydrolase n=1 Tax=Larkinella knui TaxID=2025310 RepID=A0A3P1CQ71_9BACT|nr:alpha/beta hydrolase [Larkinella knui]RRB15473.1 alpha/beta hydrolase [Larkinella knui]
MAAVTHFLITNRQIDSEQGVEVINPTGSESVSHEEPVSFRFARYTFDPENSHDKGVVILSPDPTPFQKASPDADGLGPEGGRSEVANSLANSGPVFTEVYQTLKAGSGNVLFFIHGFRSDLDITLKTIRKLHREYVHDESGIETIVAFTWPSQKDIFQYFDDQQDARLSGYAFARVFTQLHASLSGLFQTRQIHLLCHSMGNQVLFYMLERLFEHTVPPLDMFKEAVLVAADIPEDAFDPGQPLHHLVHLCEQVHVYYHQGDLALGASSLIRLRKNRLGRVGFGNSRPVPEDVFAIDVTLTPSDDTDPFLRDLIQFDRDELVKHWYYLSNSSVIKDICAIFKTGISVIRTGVSA